MYKDLTKSRANTYKNLYNAKTIMADIKENNLAKTSTDMMADMLANSEKIVSTNRRWRYQDHKDDKDDDSDLDVDPNDYLNDKPKEKNESKPSVFNKPEEKNEPKPDTKSDKKTKTDTTSDYTETETPNMSKRELMLQKLAMIRKLGELKRCGVHLSQNYNIDSNLDDMKFEYELHHDIRAKENSVQWMSHMMIGILKGTELLNDNYNPFDIKLGGLSDRIGSDMHNYYAVLGDIYEKYNQPGKQSSPEMRLLLMISGAALQLQMNRAIPGFGNSAESVKTEENLNDLRQKAEKDSKSKEKKDYFKEQHDEATQKAADIKMMREKELELKRATKITDEKKFKESLVLSSEAPSKHKSKSKKIIEQTETESEEENHLTEDEINKIRKMKYIEEQKHLEMLRKTAHMKSEMYRNSNLNQFSPNTNDKRKRDLDFQNKQLDDMLESLDDSPKIKAKNKSKSKQDLTESTASTVSTVSINPKVESIMKKTSEKAKQINAKQVSAPSIKLKPQNGSEIKFDDSIKFLLDNTDSEYDDVKDEISVGSTDKYKNKYKSQQSIVDDQSSVFASSESEIESKSKSNSQSKSSKSIDNDIYGSISIGSLNKGKKITVTTGKK